MGKLWQTYGKAIGKLWESYGYFMTGIKCSNDDDWCAQPIIHARCMCQGGYAHGPASLPADCMNNNDDNLSGSANCRRALRIIGLLDFPGIARIYMCMYYKGFQGVRGVFPFDPEYSGDSFRRSFILRVLGGLELDLSALGSSREGADFGALGSSRAILGADLGARGSSQAILGSLWESLEARIWLQIRLLSAGDPWI